MTEDEELDSIVARFRQILNRPLAPKIVLRKPAKNSAPKKSKVTKPKIRAMTPKTISVARPLARIFDWPAIQAAYDLGATYEELHARFQTYGVAIQTATREGNFKPRTISERARLGIENRRRENRLYRELDWRAIADDYVGGMTLQAICKKYKTCHSTLTRAIGDGRLLIEKTNHTKQKWAEIQRVYDTEQLTHSQTVIRFGLTSSALYVAQKRGDFHSRGRDGAKKTHPCCVCGKPIFINLIYCSLECYSPTTRKIKISDQELFHLLKSNGMNFLKTGKSLGVSDQAVRKRLRRAKLIG